MPARKPGAAPPAAAPQRRRPLPVSAASPLPRVARRAALACRSGCRDAAFWAVLLLLNSLLFLPQVLMDREDGSLLPALELAGRSADEIARQLLFWRRSPDLLRFNSELLLFVALWAFLPPARRPASLRRGFVVVYIPVFVYYLYEGASLTFFSVEPVIYSQYRLATEGLSFFIRNARVTAAFVAGILLLIVCGAILVARLSHALLPGKGPGRASRALLALLCALVAYQVTAAPRPAAQPEMVFSSAAAKLARNARESRRLYAQVKRFAEDGARPAYDYSAYRLRSRPPIYILFVESYGTVLYKRGDWRTDYATLTGRLDSALQEAGWHVASARSLAPTWGGGSWMSYTSALFGMKVSSDPQYNALLDRYESATYPDLGRFLKDQGYRYYRLTALSMGLPQSQWEQYARFYGVDRWLRYEDLNFNGPEYGWGPAPPDQFSLNFARRTARRETGGPYLLFTITQNSHYPWSPLPRLADTWEDLNHPGPAPPAASELIQHSERRMNYWRAIAYQLEMLADFILSEPDQEAVFVLVGDHQPPRVSRREDGWDTPIHVIARNRDFVASFHEYGFGSGLAVWEPEPTFRHEGFLSLFVRLLLAAYGEDGDLPPYLAEGVDFDLPNTAQDEDIH